MIRELTEDRELLDSAPLVREAFGTVAREMGLTVANCPSNPAFITPEKMLELKSKGLRCYGYFVGDYQVGFIAIENAGGGTFYLEKLAVLADFRHNGNGRQLMDHACALIRNWGGRKVSVALINENGVLKEWYRNYGFVETGTKNFPQLPFTVCFMEKNIE